MVEFLNHPELRRNFVPEIVVLQESPTWGQMRDHKFCGISHSRAFGIPGSTVSARGSDGAHVSTFVINYQLLLVVLVPLPSLT